MPDRIMHPYLKRGWITLYGFNAQTNSINGETLMWISTGIMSIEKFQLFVKDVKNQTDRNISNPSDYYTTTQARCYMTPKEICWMSWKKEFDNPTTYYTVYEGDFVQYDTYKCVEECVCNYPSKGDVYYRMPSKRVRQYLKIVEGDGKKYYNANGEVVAIYFEVGDKWGDSQSFLWVDGEKLQKELKKENQTIFWITRVQREATPKGMEMHPDCTDQYNRCWLHWLENEKWRSIMYVEPELV